MSQYDTRIPCPQCGRGTILRITNIAKKKSNILRLVMCSLTLSLNRRFVRLHVLRCSACQREFSELPPPNRC